MTTYLTRRKTTGQCLYFGTDKTQALTNGVYYCSSDIKASKVIQDLTFEYKTTGFEGNNVSIIYRKPSLEDSPLAVDLTSTVIKKEISVKLGDTSGSLCE